MNLRDFLRPSLAAVHVHVDDWEEAIRAVGALMVAEGAVEPRFVDAMIRVAKEFGPYIVIAPGIAMPHARPEDGCIRSTMAAITLAEPINFGNQQNDPVTFVIALAAVDNQQHIDGLAELASVMDDDHILEKLNAAKTPAELLEIMWSKSEEAV